MGLSLPLSLGAARNRRWSRRIGIRAAIFPPQQADRESLSVPDRCDPKRGFVHSRRGDAGWPRQGAAVVDQLAILPQERHGRVVNSFSSLARKLQARLTTAIRISPQLLEVKERIRSNDEHAARITIYRGVGVKKIGVEGEEHGGRGAPLHFLGQKRGIADIGG